jgi:alkylation response protein AidB-like acyl-CoA dehydrogenase
MDFSLTPAQSALKSEIAEFASTLNDGVEQDDEQKIFPQEKWKQCAEFGVQGLQIPQVFGGRGCDMLTSIIAMEGMGYGCRDNGLSFTLNGQMLIQLPIVHFASDVQKQRYLPGLADGSLMGAFAFTEPECGSDLYSIKTTAVKFDNGSYCLSGTKAFISFAPIADFAVVFATTNPALREWGLTAFLVDLKENGVNVSESRTKMGLRTVPSGEINFENCIIGADALFGSEGGGLGILNRALEWDRCCVLASQLGAMERQLEDCIAYAKSREQFGQSIGKFQSVSNRIADMKLRLETSRLLLYKSAWLVDQGQPAVLDSALSKLSLSENFVESSLDAIRVHGGKGYLADFGVERSLRDSVGGILYGGTSDIQRVTIAKMLGL